MDLHETQRLLTVALAADADDPKGLGPLLERLRPRLVLWCASRMSPAMRALHEPEDMAQIVLMAITKDFHTYRGSADRAFFKWMFVVAEHRLKDQAREDGAEFRRPIEPREGPAQTTPSQAAVRVESVVRLHAAIRRLPDEYRRVVALYKLESRDVDDVAQIMDRTPNAVRILYCRALKELRALLGGSSVIQNGAPNSTPSGA